MQESHGLLSNNEPMRDKFQCDAPRKVVQQSNRYVFWAALGGVLIALSGVIRGVESSKPLPAKFTLSLAYLILSLLTIMRYKCKLGKDFHCPWMQKVPVKQDQTN